MVDDFYKYEAIGKVRYGKHKDDGGSGWCLIDCPQDIADYYNAVCRWLLWNKGITVPMHGSHITVIAGKYTDVDYDRWGYRHGEEVPFQYGTIQDNKEGYFWLPCKCEAAVDIRTHFGLTPTPLFQYHLTIGYNNK
jgi:hypothetical protein